MTHNKLKGEYCTSYFFSSCKSDSYLNNLCFD